MSEAKFGTKILQTFTNEVETLSGFSLAAKANSGYARLFWILVSIISSAACAFYLIQAWWEFQKYATNVKVSVKYLILIYVIIACSFASCAAQSNWLRKLQPLP